MDIAKTPIGKLHPFCPGIKTGKGLPSVFCKRQALEPRGPWNRLARPFRAV